MNLFLTLMCIVTAINFMNACITIAVAYFYMKGARINARTAQMLADLSNGPRP